ncbi:MAG: hypothetical protein IPJ86_06010 [Bacteroidetes bacterium]|nr:hypothetical protein [Bacteroidota bacterium]
MKYAGTFGFKAAGGISFYGGNDYPSYTNGEPKTFDELSGGENDGLRRLGVLRMDVDNLGKLFVDGFKHGMNTFSRYSALSRNLDYFFKGYLNEIWRSDAGFRDKTSIIYSGGDDLFIVGQWNETIRFAKRIREEFKKYICSNDKLSISGGIAIVSSKFPIAKAALLSGEAEHLAKDHTFGKLEKNAFAMMGLPLNWDFELPYVEE